MRYNILADSPALFEFADENTRLSVFDALIIEGKVTNYHFETPLFIQEQKIPDNTPTVKGKPVECLLVGGNFYISEKIKNILVSHAVKAEYYSSFIKVSNELFDEKYYLFNPLIGVDCIDYENSEYEKVYDDWDKIYDVSKFSRLELLESKITLNEPLFFIKSPDETNNNNLRLMPYIIVITKRLAQDLHKANLRGLNIFEVNDYRHDWKWNNEA
ncbi:MAG: DUF1629 domain-containing protein [Methylococcaceae bacterium]